MNSYFNTPKSFKKKKARKTWYVYKIVFLFFIVYPHLYHRNKRRFHFRFFEVQNYL